MFLASPAALRTGHYTLTELALAQQRWPRPAGHVLPVLTAGTTLDSLPAYLRSVSVLQPQGDLVAEVVDAVARVKKRARFALLLRLLGGGLVLVAALVSSYLFFWPKAEVRIRGVSIEQVKDGYRVSATLRNGRAEAVTVLNLYAEANDPYIKFPGSVEWIDMNAGEDKATSIVVHLVGADAPSAFKWRFCSTVANSLDLHLAKDEQTIEKLSKTVCTAYRPWAWVRATRQDGP